MWGGAAWGPCTFLLRHERRLRALGAPVPPGVRPHPGISGTRIERGPVSPRFRKSLGTERRSRSGPFLYGGGGASRVPRTPLITGPPQVGACAVRPLPSSFRERLGAVPVASEAPAGPHRERGGLRGVGGPSSEAVLVSCQDVKVALGDRVVCRPALEHHHPAV